MWRPLLALVVGAGAHVWFPPLARDNATLARELTTANCASTVLSPAWTTGPSTAALFSSYHLHIAWAAGNTAQVAAVAAFKGYLTSVAGASASCSSVADTSTYFCISQTTNAYSASEKTNPFYNVRLLPPLPLPRRCGA